MVNLSSAAKSWRRGVPYTKQDGQESKCWMRLHTLGSQASNVPSRQLAQDSCCPISVQLSHLLRDVWNTGSSWHRAAVCNLQLILRSRLEIQAAELFAVLAQCVALSVPLSCLGGTDQWQCRALRAMLSQLVPTVCTLI